MGLGEGRACFPNSIRKLSGFRDGTESEQTLPVRSRHSEIRAERLQQGHSMCLAQARSEVE